MCEEYNYSLDRGLRNRRAHPGVVPGTNTVLAKAGAFGGVQLDKRSLERIATLKIDLSLYETRVVGSLIEKEITTPEQYPLSLNALLSACNQNSNRNPVMKLDEATVQQTVDELVKRHLVSTKSGFGSRVTKYQHRLCNSEFGILKFSEQELGVVCVLLLRGPQTPGELRTRTSRLCQFGDVQEVEDALKGLIEREDGPFVARLPREPGTRESRYAHLFSGEVKPSAISEGGNTMADLPNSDQERLDRLEQLVSELQQEMEQLKRRLEAVQPTVALGRSEA